MHAKISATMEPDHYGPQKSGRIKRVAVLKGRFNLKKND